MSNPSFLPVDPLFVLYDKGCNLFQNNISLTKYTVCLPEIFLKTLKSGLERDSASI